MSHDSHPTLSNALQSMRDVAVPSESLYRALDRAKRIDGRPNGAEPPRPAREARRWPIRRVHIFGRVAAMLLVAGSAAVIGAMLLGGNGRLAYAQLHEVMQKLESVHLVILSPQENEENARVEVWYQRGVGFAMQNSFGWETDNGEHLVRYFRSWRVAVRSPSRIAANDFSDARQLGEMMGFYIEDMPEDLVRFGEADVTLDGETLRAYVAELPDLPTFDNPPEELWPQRRLVFLLDQNDRLRRCVHERGLNGTWKAYRTLEIAYPGEIPAERFAIQLADDVRVVDANKQGLDVDPEVRALVAGIERRQEDYLGLEFTYDVSIETKPSPESQLPQDPDSFTSGVLRTRDKLALLPPEDPAADRPWRRWMQEERGRLRFWNARAWSAFDGSVTRILQTPRGEWTAQGRAVPWEAWDHWSENHFDKLLTLQVNGGDGTYPQTDELRELHLSRFHLIGRRREDGREIVMLHGSSTPEFGVEYEVEMTTDPDFLILRWEARNSRRDNSLLMRYRITKVEQFEGISYPAEGSFRQAAVRELPDVTYSFRVTGVERLEESVRETWFPAWPGGTHVNDQVNERRFVAQESD